MKTFKYMLIIMLVLFAAGIAAAQDTEEITLTTYYPAPYGDYKEITAEEISVNRASVGADATSPETDGVVNFASIPEPAASSSAIGDIYFDGTDFKYYRSDEAGWSQLGGEGIKIQRRRVRIPPPVASTYTTYSINFSNAFDSIPIVFVQMDTTVPSNPGSSWHGWRYLDSGWGTGGHAWVYVKNISLTGFQLGLNISPVAADAEFFLNYIAIEP
jgi:hypothetical protein